MGDSVKASLREEARNPGTPDVFPVVVGGRSFFSCKDSNISTTASDKGEFVLFIPLACAASFSTDFRIPLFSQ